MEYIKVDTNEAINRFTTYTNLGITFLKKPFKLSEEDHEEYLNILAPIDYSFSKFNVEFPDFFCRTEVPTEEAAYRFELSHVKPCSENIINVDFNMYFNECTDNSHPFVKIQIIGDAEVNQTTRTVKTSKLRTVNAWIIRGEEEISIEDWFTTFHPKECFANMFDPQQFADFIALMAYKSESIQKHLSTQALS